MSRVERHAAQEAALREKDRQSAAGGGEKPSGRSGKGRLTAAGRLLNIAGTLIMAAAIIVGLGLSLPRLAGIKTYVVVSGSMEPSIPVWSIVYSKEVDPAMLEPGDVIVFYSSEAASESSGSSGAVPITHRVVENLRGSSEIITKGDANENADLSPAAYANVEGRVVLHIPAVGRLAALLSSAAGKIAIVLMILAGYLLTEAGGRMRR